MKIKFNWGTGLLIFIILFVGLLTGVIIYSMSLDINLVSSDYYDKEVGYESQIQKIKNTDALSEKVKIENEDSKLKFIFPSIIKGKKFFASVQLYCYTDRHKDTVFVVTPDTSNLATVVCNKKIKGRYAVKLDWKIDNISYYQEKDIIFP